MSESRTLSNIPIPDPSLLTTEQIRREIASLGDQIRREITALRELHETKFTALNTLIEHDSRAAQTAIAAAMAAQKEAATKAEAAAGDLMKELGRRVDELKARLDKGEGVDRGATDTRGEQRQAIGVFVGLGGLVIGLVSAIVAILAIVSLPHSPPVPVTVTTPPALLK